MLVEPTDCKNYQYEAVGRTNALPSFWNSDSQVLVSLVVLECLYIDFNCFVLSSVLYSAFIVFLGGVGLI